METKTINKTKLIILLSSIAAFIALMIVAAFLDLKINIALRNPDSIFGQLGEYLGEFSAYAAAGVALMIIFQSITKDNKFYLALKILFGILAFVGILVFVNYLMGKFFKEEIMYKPMYLIIFSLVSTALAMLGTYKIDKKLMKRLVLLAIMLLAVLAISQIITTIAKGLWSRLRFRHMNANYDGFTPWYKLNLNTTGREHLVMPDNYPPYHPAKDAFNSFPSGHTAAAGLTVSLILLPDLFDKFKKHKVWFYVCPIVYSLLVAVSRMVARAHFLSDVLVGFAIAMGSVFLVRWLILLVEEKLNQKKQSASQEQSTEEPLQEAQPAKAQQAE